MKNYLLVLTSFLFAGSMASAAVSINDPQNFLGQLQSKLQTSDFNSLFKVGQTASFDQYVESCEIQCSDGGPDSFAGCSSMCKEMPAVVNRSVLKVEDGKAVVYSPEDGSYEEITPTDIQACHGSLAERYLANLDVLLNLQGVVTLEKFSTFELPVGIGTSRERKVTAYSLWGSFLINGNKTPFAVKVSVVPSAPGVGQVAMFTAVGQVYFRLKDF